MTQKQHNHDATELLARGVLHTYTKDLDHGKEGDGDGMENMLKLDGDNDEVNADIEDTERFEKFNEHGEEVEVEGAEEIEVEGAEEGEGEDVETRGDAHVDVQVGEVDEEGEEVEAESENNGLLETLATDIEKYHKKVQLKKKKFDASAIAMERKIVEDLNKSNNNDKKRNLDNVENNGEGVDKPAKRRPGRKPINRQTKEWTKSEDDAIVYYKEEMKYSWKRIEELLDNKHSWQAIQMRYLRNHKSRNDEWSRYMEVKLVNAIRKDWENRWKRISADLGKDFGPERCVTKNIEICKKMELPYYNSVFANKDIVQGYTNQFHDIKDSEAHKKLLLVYMGLDSITYEESDEEGNKEDISKGNERDEEGDEETTVADKPDVSADPVAVAAAVQAAAVATNEEDKSAPNGDFAT
jgi:hypothetical protein